MRGLALRSRHARDEVEIAGAASPFSVDRGPVMSSWRREEADAAGGLRLSAAAVPAPRGHPPGAPRQLPARPLPPRRKQLFTTESGRWACVTPRAGEKEFLAGVGQSSLLLLKDPFSWRDS